MSEESNIYPQKIVTYCIREWHPLPEHNAALVKGVADGEDFNGILFFGKHPEREGAV